MSGSIVLGDVKGGITLTSLGSNRTHIVLDDVAPTGISSLSTYQHVQARGYGGTQDEFHDGLIDAVENTLPTFTRHIFGSTTLVVNERVEMQSTGTLTLPAAVADDEILIAASGGDVTLVGNGADTVAGALSATIQQGSTYVAIYETGNWKMVGWGSDQSLFMALPLAP